MVRREGLNGEDLDLCFKKLMVLGAGVGGGEDRKMDVEVIHEWKDIPVELLLRILLLLDDQSVIRVS
ncbi:hypothetical protein Dimus_005351, partial [Dionaea muscipula]